MMNCPIHAPTPCCHTARQIRRLRSTCWPGTWCCISSSHHCINAAHQLWLLLLARSQTNSTIVRLARSLRMLYASSAATAAQVCSLCGINAISKEIRQCSNDITGISIWMWTTRNQKCYTIITANCSWSSCIPNACHTHGNQTYHGDLVLNLLKLPFHQGLCKVFASCSSCCVCVCVCVCVCARACVCMCLYVSVRMVLFDQPQFLCDMHIHMCDMGHELFKCVQSLYVTHSYVRHGSSTGLQLLISFVLCALTAQVCMYMYLSIYTYIYIYICIFIHTQYMCV